MGKEIGELVSNESRGRVGERERDREQCINEY